MLVLRQDSSCLGVVLHCLKELLVPGELLESGELLVPGELLVMEELLVPEVC